MGRLFSSRLQSNLLVSLSLVSRVVIASIPTGQWVVLDQSIFRNLPVQAGWAYKCLHREWFCAATAILILASIYANGWIEPVRKVLGHRFIYSVAQVSYSAYLLHEMFMFWLFPNIKYLVGDQLGVCHWPS